MREKLKNEISRAVRLLYSEVKEVDAVIRPSVFKREKNLLVQLIAVRTAVRLTEPLKRSDVDRAFSELNASLALYKQKHLFGEVMRLNQNLASLRWSEAALRILRRKAAHQADEYSDEGVRYELERAWMGPCGREKLEQARGLARKVRQASIEVEKAELRALEEQDPIGRAQYVEELELEKQRKERLLDAIAPDSEEEQEGRELLEEMEGKLESLLNGGDYDFYES